MGGGIGEGEWHNVALGESTFVAPEPGSPFVTYGSGYYSAFVRLDFSGITGDAKNVSPWPRYMAGAASGETKYRFRMDGILDLLLTGESARAGWRPRKSSSRAPIAARPGRRSAPT